MLEFRRPQECGGMIFLYCCHHQPNLLGHFSIISVLQIWYDFARQSELLGLAKTDVVATRDCLHFGQVSYQQLA